MVARLHPTGAELVLFIFWFTFFETRDLATKGRGNNFLFGCIDKPPFCSNIA